MNPTLCYSPGACSMAPHIVLHEIGAPFQVRKFATSERANYSPEYLAINPKGRIPALLIDGFTLTENPAILAYLGRRFAAAKLYPAQSGEDEARTLEWLAWLSNSVHIAVAQVLRPNRYADADTGHPAIKESGVANLRTMYKSIDTHFAKHTYAVGSNFSVADANLVPYYRWGNGRVGIDMAKDYPAFTAFIHRIGERASVKNVLATEEIGLLK